MECRPWTHRSISLEDLVRHSGAFLDMLVLASGFQSTGARASWSIETVEQAFSWAFFLEDAMEELVDEDSKLALDEALASLMDRTPHPPGLPNLSVAVLMEAGVLLLRLLLQALGDENVQIACVAAAVAKIEARSVEGVRQLPHGEQSLHEQALPKVASSCDGSKCMATDGLLYLDGKMGGSTENCNMDVQPARKKYRSSGGCVDMWSSVHQEISERCSATAHVNCLAKAVEAAAEVNSSVNEISPAVTLWRNEEHMDDDVTSSSGGISFSKVQVAQWRQSGLSYLVSAKTMYKLSGALIIFQGTKLQWTQVFDALRTGDGVKAKADDGCLTEIAELCCMYLGYKRWTAICRKLLGSSNSSATCQNMLSKLSEFTCLLQAEKEVEIESYLVELTAMKNEIWWTLSPVLLAAAVTASSRLLNIYTESLLLHVTHASARSAHTVCHVCIGGRQSCTAVVAERTWSLLVSYGDDLSIPNENLENLLNLIAGLETA